MKSILRLLLALVVVASGTAAAQFDRGPADVLVDEARYTLLAPSVDVPGTVVSRNDARLAAEISAKVVWIAEIGARVKKDEAVARLEDIIFRLLEMEAANEVKREEARVRYLKSEVARLRELATKNNAAESLLDKTISDLGVAESEEAIARARHGRARVALAVTEIRAPFDGIVTERLRNLGERLNDADEVIRLVDPASVEIVARAPLNTVNFVAQNDELAVHNDYKDDRASVRTIVPFGNPQSHMFEVRLDIDPKNWVVGESVRVSMPTSEAREVLTVPRDALVLRREGASVFRVNDDMTAEKISVITGQGAGSLIEVIGELEAGDIVIVRGAERLETGMSVVISSNSASAATRQSKL